MGKQFWIALCFFALCLAVSVSVVYSIEEYRWHAAVVSVEGIATGIKETNEKTDDLIKILREFGEEKKAREEADKQKDHEKMVAITLAIIERNSKTFENTAEVLPNVEEFFKRERKTNLRSALFSVLIFVFVAFVAFASIKTSRRLSKEAGELAVQRDELARRKQDLDCVQENLNRQMVSLAVAGEDLAKKKALVDDLLRASTPALEHVSGRKRRRHPKSHQEPPPEFAQGALSPWKFWVTFSTNDLGQKLPQERGEFLKTLQVALDSVGYRNLDPALVYDKLCLFGQLSLQQRQSRKEVSHTEPIGRKILRVGRQHRLFLSIDEESRQMRFLPCPRKEAYPHH